MTTRGRESRKDASPPGVSEKGGEGEWKRERRGVTGGQRESREGEERGRNRWRTGRKGAETKYLEGNSLQNGAGQM